MNLGCFRLVFLSGFYALAYMFRWDLSPVKKESAPQKGLKKKSSSQIIKFKDYPMLSIKRVSCYARML
jgi:hypothetical protein